MAVSASSPPVPDHRSTKHYILALIWVNFTVVLLIVISALFHERAHGQRLAITIEIHLRAAGTVQDVVKNLIVLRGDLDALSNLQATPTTADDRSGAMERVRNDIADRIYALQQGRLTLSEIHAQKISKRINDSHQRIEQAFDMLPDLLGTGIRTGAPPGPPVGERVDVLELQLDQLGRLHMRAHDEIESKLAVTSTAERDTLLIVSLFLLSIGGLVTLVIVDRLETAYRGRMAAQTAAQKSEMLFRATFDNAPVGIALGSPAGELLEVNRAFGDIMMLPPSGLTGRNDRDHTHPDDLDDSAEYVREILEGKTQSSVSQKRYVRGDGSVVWTNRTLSLVRDAAGEPDFFIAIIEDITERRQAEQEAERNHRRLIDAVESMSVGIVQYDADDRVILWNSSYAGLYPEVVARLSPGVTLDEMLRVHAAQGMIPQTSDSIDEWVAERIRIRAQKEGIPIEAGLADGRWVLITDHPTSDGGTISVHADITDLKTREEALRQSEHRFQQAFQLSPGITAITEIETGRLVDVSDRWLETMGYARDEVIGHTTLELGTWKDPADRARFVSNLEKEGHIRDHEAQFRTKSGDIGDFVIGAEIVRVDGQPHMLFVAHDITERKQAASTLQQTMEGLNEAQRLGQMGSWTRSEDMGLGWWSDELYRIFGLEHGPAVPERADFLNYVHPEDYEMVERLEHRAVDEKIDYSVDYRIVRPDGTERTVTEQCVWIEDGPSGKPLWRGVVQDITARKQAERALRDSEARFDAFFTEAPAGLAIMDSDARYVKINETLARINGAPVEDHIGKRPSDIMPREMAELVEANLRRTLEGGEAFDNEEISAPGPDGRVGCWVYSQFPTTGDPRKPDGLGVVVVDVTDLKEAQRELRESEARLDAFFASAPAGLGIVGRDHRFIRLNETLARINKTSIDNHIGRAPEDIFPPALAAEINTEMDHTFKNGETLLNEEFFVDDPGQPGGKSHWVFSQFPISGDRHRPDALGIVTVDHTEQKLAEAELARLNAELETRVRERTESLEAAQAELVRGERLSTLGQLTATVSHELRNPLATIRTSMYVIEKRVGSDDERIVGAIARVNRNINRCDRIIDELLDFTRIRDLELRDTCIDDWLGTLLDEQAVPEGVTVRRKFGAPGMRVPADVDRLHRAVLNVYDNACQAMMGAEDERQPSGGHRLTVETRVRKHRLEIIVADNGPGIAKDDMPRIFDPLFSTKSFGVGLGLPAVQQIMEQHDGGVDVSTTKRTGARFTLWLPVTQASEAADA